ncbi:hypothetical protein Agub_g8475 [Astrephomene gubernaculifera]|uniref:RING-type E3 ubiquitin transferase n=1 Tax=Astrephomene gubernaculifera TaxID=47775 RepID=A0AAD3HN41_9CHLO|nr:hypothetical protein Agub_g8475 [Astrephomene gubernaculifera]
MLRVFAATRTASMDLEQGYGASSGQNSRRALRRTETSSAQLQTTNSAATYSRAILGFCLVLLVLGVLPASFVLWTCILVLIITCIRVRVHTQRIQHPFEQDDLVPTDALSSRVLHAGGLSGVLAGGHALGQGVGAVMPHPVVRMIPGGGGVLVLHTDPRAALDLLEMRLRNLDEEAEYMLQPGSQQPALAAGGAPRRPPALDVDIATLPCFPYKAHRTPPIASPSVRPQGGKQEAAVAAPQTEVAASGCCPTGEACGVSSSSSNGCGGAASGCSGGSSCISIGGVDASHQQQQQQHLAKALASASSSGGICSASHSEASGSSSSQPCATAASLANEDGPENGCGSELTCPVCLDMVEEGSLVMTLPCLHQYHAACVTPWLRQQGLLATCPMCKTPVFR